MALFYFGTKSRKLIPTPVQNFFEWIIESLFGLFDGMTGTDKKIRRNFPLVATLFILY